MLYFSEDQTWIEKWLGIAPNIEFYRWGQECYNIILYYIESDIEIFVDFFKKLFGQTFG